MDLHQFVAVLQIDVHPQAKLHLKVIFEAVALVQTLIMLFLCALFIAAGACVGVRWVL